MQMMAQPSMTQTPSMTQPVAVPSGGRASAALASAGDDSGDLYGSAPGYSGRSCEAGSARRSRRAASSVPAITKLLKTQSGAAFCFQCFVHV